MDRRSKFILFGSFGRVLALVGTLVTTFAISAATDAASLKARITSAPPVTGERFMLEVLLQLDASESASVFEAQFELHGLGQTVAFAADGPANNPDSSWTSAQSHWQGSVLRVSLTSDNTGGTRQVVGVALVGLEPGPVELHLAAQPIAQTDEDAYPYLVDIPLSLPPLSEPLVAARVRDPFEIPIPPLAWLLMSLGLLGASFALRLVRPSRRAT